MTILLSIVLRFCAIDLASFSEDMCSYAIISITLLRIYVSSSYQSHICYWSVLKLLLNEDIETGLYRRQDGRQSDGDIYIPRSDTVTHICRLATCFSIQTLPCIPIQRSTLSLNLSKLENAYQIIHNNSVWTSQKTHFISGTKINRLMLFKVLTAVHSQNYTNM